jgi:hypothetical protein
VAPRISFGLRLMLMGGTPMLLFATEDRWAALAPLGADLVYAAPAEAGSAGMFGHVLLRVRGANGEVAIGYAADIGDDNPLSLAWKGLTGGYTAGYIIEPWKQELRGYQITEGRPVWVFPLLLDRAGLDRLLADIAGRQDRRSSYHLLSGNCAGGIADLLDSAQPAAGVRDGIGGCASPAGVVRAAHAAGLIDAGSRLPGPGSDRFNPVADPPAGRLALGGGRDGEEGYAGLAWRPAWHAQDDRRGSIALGDALETLAVEMRWQLDSERLVLQRATLLAVESFAQRPSRPLGWAWQASLGSRRERCGEAGSADQQAALAGGWGIGWAPHEDLVAWLTASADLRLVEDLARPAGGGGISGGVLLGFAGGVLDLRARALRWDGQAGTYELEADAVLSLPLGRHSGIALEAAWRDAGDWQAATWAAGWRLYF